MEGAEAFNKHLRAVADDREDRKTNGFDAAFVEFCNQQMETIASKKTRSRKRKIVETRPKFLTYAEVLAEKEEQKKKNQRETNVAESNIVVPPRRRAKRTVASVSVITQETKDESEEESNDEDERVGEI